MCPRRPAQHYRRHHQEGGAGQRAAAAAATHSIKHQHPRMRVQNENWHVDVFLTLKTFTRGEKKPYHPAYKQLWSENTFVGGLVW